MRISFRNHYYHKLTLHSMITFCSPKLARVSIKMPLCSLWNFIYSESNFHHLSKESSLKSFWFWANSLRNDLRPFCKPDRCSTNWVSCYQTPCRLRWLLCVLPAALLGLCCYVLQFDVWLVEETQYKLPSEGEIL